MDLVTVLNTIHANASATYQNRIPEATRTNLEDIRYAMIDDDNVMVANEFMGTLLNKLVKSVVHTKRFQNPLKSLKKGKKPLGDTVEEIYNNFIKGQQYSATAGATELMQRSLPDTKTLYHRMNLQMKYPITVSREILSKAFASWDALEKYINDVIAQLYNSAELDEFVNMKQLFKSAMDAKAMKVITVADPLLGEAEGKEFIKAVKTVSNLMQFPNSDFNAYLTAQNTDEKPIVTFSRKNEQVLIISAAADTSVSVDVLASTFNMSVADFNDTRKIVIDAFPSATVRAALVDEAFFQIYDDLFLIKSFDNGVSVYENYWLHVWQTMAYSILVNAVVFDTAEAA
jgi:hypothetical protein